MNNPKTIKEQIEERLNNIKIEIRLPFDLHRKMTDMIFEAAHNVGRACDESEKKDDQLLKEMADNVEKKLVRFGLREVGRRLDLGNGPFIKFNVKLETLFNVLNMKG